MIEIIVNQKFSSRVQRSRLKRLAARALRVEKKNVSFTIYLTDDKEIRALNRRFHATDAATDVLAFPYSRIAADSEEKYLGDIIISYERARVQSHKANWRVADELDLLAVHGLLHLLGYDDKSARAHQKMWRRQEKILGRPANG